MDMNAKLDMWKNRLLDLGKRNQLLNFRETKASSLKIIKPDIYSLWESFVVNEKPLEFPFYDDSADGSGESLPSAQEPAVITNKTAKLLQSTLRNLRNKAKTFSEEQGINVLYLSFGLLRWEEAPQSKVTMDAPIILVPVRLTWDSITSPFVLSLHEDEIVVNSTLKFKLENDFGIVMPEFDPDEGLHAYFSKLNYAVSSTHWEIIPETVLALFSFLKINMYHDLENHREEILENPVIRTLCGDGKAVEHDISFLDGLDYDRNIKPEDTFQVVDADSSQMDAILCAKKGISFVLQGPPGTGKSQTITNIIAECLADGKKVLFVSEKMAALEVVQKRLKDAGLTDFCLVLHSHKANKKDTLAQLGEVLNLASQKASLSDEAYRKLNQLTEYKKQLDNYSDSLHTVIPPLNKTIYDVNGEIAGLQGYDDIVFSVADVRNTTFDRYNEYLGALDMFKNTVSGLSVDYRANPWKNASVDYVTNELRHDIGSHIGKMIPLTDKISELYSEIRSDLNLYADTSYSAWKRNAELLSAASEAPEIPVFWITEKDIDELKHTALECDKRSRQIAELRQKISELRHTISEKDRAADLSEYINILTVGDAERLSLKIKQIIDSDELYSIWENTKVFGKVKNLFQKLSEQVNEHNEIETELQSEFEREIFSIDYNGMFIRFRSEYKSLFKFINGNYRADKKLVQGLCKNDGRKFSDGDILDALNRLRRLDEISEEISSGSADYKAAFGSLYNADRSDLNVINLKICAYDELEQCRSILNQVKDLMAAEDNCSAEMSKLFGKLYKGSETDWEKVYPIISWAEGFKKSVGDMKAVTEDFLVNIFNSDAKRKQCREYSEKLERLFGEFSGDFEWFLNLFEPDDELRNMPIDNLKIRLLDCMERLSSLEEWIDFRASRSRLYELGLREYADQVERLNIPPQNVVPIFKKRFFRLWLDSVTPEYPAVANFRRRVQDEAIAEFSNLDKLQFSIASSRIRSKLINSLPSFEHFTSGVDEVSILKRELSKQRRIMPTRLLFAKIPNLILSLKPCLMMSPLSVSLFLESEEFKFDTVIFDEASQVCTENAVGAILRGKQVIIAGDSKQLPPTNFFNASYSDSDFDDNEEEYDDSASYESILDEASLLPERTLLWHYRSRHEHLITFSNAKIYRNNLITFPSTVEKTADMGVEYVFVPQGYYDRGGRKGNVIEAKRVAELVFEHFRKYPNRSLGVIAFGEVQQLAIDTAIRKIRLEHQEFEEFFREDRHDAFFIKSLESVQGDERDTIIFSIGYAKDFAGVMRMNFGPLSQQGGERRLNVAITRAKYNVKLVGSILPTDIDTDRVSADGPKLLRSYIDFAMNGYSVLAADIKEPDIIQHDSPFEASVFNFLERNGYKLATQVGCSGFRIDIAVKHPFLSGRYVLGIECDGASYHSARTARERDRLRQDVLENMGWRIYRIWSTDWIKDPLTEGKRLLEAVENAVNSYSENTPAPPKEPEIEPAPDSFYTVEDKPESDTNPDNPYGFIVSEGADVDKFIREMGGRATVANCVEFIVKNEYPVHFDIVCRKMSPLLGREKTTVVVQQEVNAALIRLRGKVKVKGSFLYPADYTEIPVRLIKGRTIKYISTDELAAAMMLILKKCIGATKASLIDETSRAFGFTRKGVNITNAMNEAYEQLLKDGKITESGEKITVV